MNYSIQIDTPFSIRTNDDIMKYLSCNNYNLKYNYDVAFYWNNSIDEALYKKFLMNVHHVYLYNYNGFEIPEDNILCSVIFAGQGTVVNENSFKNITQLKNFYIQADISNRVNIDYLSHIKLSAKLNCNICNPIKD